MMVSKEKIAERDRRYYAVNKEKIAERAKLYREANKEKIAEYKKCHYAANRAKIAEKARLYRVVNREKRKEYDRRYYAGNKEEFRRGWFRREYGLPLEVYNTLIDGQHFSCSICSAPDFSDGKHLRIDHDHATGWVRGLLCDLCNRALGFLRDDPELVNRAAAYLRFHKREGRLIVKEASLAPS